MGAPGGDLAGFGQHLEEELARERSPAVAAAALGSGAADDLGERFGAAEDEVDRGV